MKKVFLSLVLLVMLASCESEGGGTISGKSLRKNTGIILECYDSDGNNLAEDEKFIKQIKILNTQTNKEIPLDVLRYTGLDDSYNCYLFFIADFPDVEDVQFDNHNIAYWESTINLCVGEQILPLHCTIEYSSESLIQGDLHKVFVKVKEVTCNDVRITGDPDRRINESIVLYLEKTEDGYIIK